MKVHLLSVLAILLGDVAGEQRCQEDSQGVRRYNGTPCASTTRYDDGHRGACGCGPPASDIPFNWNLGDFVAAPNQAYFDDGGPNRWCGKKCGVCVKLTPTGGFVPLKGRKPKDLSPKVFVVTNDCPPQGNFEWCGQAGEPGKNEVNSHGYEVHFDLQNNEDQMTKLGWDNPEVTFEEVSCNDEQQNKYGQCECS